MLCQDRVLATGAPFPGGFMRKFFPAVAVAIGFCAPAIAADTIDTSRAAFQTAVGGHASNVCYTAFDGAINFKFFGAANGLGKRPTLLKGKLWGSLLPCAGLNEFPTTGTAIRTDSTVALGFSENVVDNGPSFFCGPVSFVATFSSSSARTGSIQLYNSRSDFGNSGTIDQVACDTISNERALVAPSEPDALGNSAR
jgi:hypothetical protein